MKKLFLLMLLLVACGQDQPSLPEGFTRVVFYSPENKAAVLPGGIIIYLRSKDQPKLRATIYWGDEFTPGSSPKTLDLPNGSYEFFAIGYTLASPNQMTAGNLAYCGYPEGGPNVALSGGTLILNFKMYASTNATERCDLPPFTTSGFEGPANESFQMLKIFNCVEAPPATLVAGATCGGGGLTPGTVATLGGSYKVTYLSYRPTGPDHDPLSQYTIQNSPISFCATTTTAGNQLLSTTNQTFPVGFGADSPIAIRIEVHTGNAACGTSNPVIYDFPQGLINGGSGSNGGKAKVYDDSNYTQIYLQG